MIVVTGGAGFIGSNIVAELEEQGRYGPVVVVDTLGNQFKYMNLAQRSNLHAIAPPDHIGGILDQLRERITAVVHMGAITDTGVTDADLAWQTNYTLTQNLWRWCRDQGKRFIYASSAATYGHGEGPIGFTDTEEPGALSLIDSRALTLYAWTKHKFDQWAAQQAAKGACPKQWVGLKFFNVYGPNENHKGHMASIVWQQARRMARREPAQLFRNSELYTRDFVDVADVARVVCWFLSRLKVSGIFNVGSGVAHSWVDVVRVMHGELPPVARAPEPFEYVDMPADMQDTYQQHTQASLNKLRAVGYTEPFTPMQQGVSEYMKRLLGGLGQVYR